MTHYIRFPDESTGMAALDAAGLTTTNEDGDTVVLTASHTHALDVIGLISDCDGWHANYIGELPEGWDAYVVNPESPVRVFL
jgi:hypothetical protein